MHSWYSLRPHGTSTWTSHVPCSLGDVRAPSITERDVLGGKSVSAPTPSLAGNAVCHMHYAAMLPWWLSGDGIALGISNHMAQDQGAMLPFGSIIQARSSREMVPVASAHVIPHSQTSSIWLSWHKHSGGAKVHPSPLCIDLALSFLGLRQLRDTVRQPQPLTGL